MDAKQPAGAPVRDDMSVSPEHLKEGRVRPVLRAHTHSPIWLPSPWNTPLVGYTAAFCLAAATVLIAWGMLQLFPSLTLPTVLPLLAPLVVALAWGTGPGIVATLVGVILLDVFVLYPAFAWTLSLFLPLTEMLVFLLVGIAISVLVSRVEYARSEAEVAREQVTRQAAELEAILAAIADEVFVYDTHMRVVRANPAAQVFNPFTQQADYLAKPYPERFVQFQPRDEKGQLLEGDALPTARVLRGEVLTGAQAVDTLLRTVDGRAVLFNISGAPIRGEDGVIRGAVVVMRDVTERRRENRESAERAHQFQVLFDAVPDMVTVFDQQGRIAQLNEGARHLLGRYATTMDENAEQRLKQIQPRDPDGSVLDELSAPVWRLLHGETLKSEHAQDVVVTTLSGEELWLSVAGAPLYNSEGDITGAVAVTRDLTVARRNVQRTRESLHALLQFAEALVRAEVTSERDQGSRLDIAAQRLATLMSQVSGYPLVSLTAFREATQEPQAMAVHGLTPEQEEAWRERRPGSTIGELMKDFSAVSQRLQAGESTILDTNGLLPGEHTYGARRFLLVPMQLDGHLTGVATFAARDAEHDYGSEEMALAKVLSQLASLTLERVRLFQERTQSEATVLALRETNRLMDEFIGIAGHELRTPLTTIKASVQLARRQVNKLLKQPQLLQPGVATVIATIQGHLDRTERQIGMQNRLVSDLLDVARLHSERLELHPDLYDLAVLVGETVEDQRYLVPTRTIELNRESGEELLVLADADRVRQVISNYLSNALKYSDASRAVEVCLEVVGRMARVAVRDEGPGLSREQQMHIWERFYRVPSVEVRSGSGVGLGLGLYISRTIIERLGGQVGVQSVPGQGSTFWFTLPLAEAGEKS